MDLILIDDLENISLKIDSQSFEMRINIYNFSKNALQKGISESLSSMKSERAFICIPVYLSTSLLMLKLMIQKQT